MMSVIEPVFIRVLNMSLTAGIVVGIVLLMRLLLRRMPKIFSYVLWSVVLFRLLCPISFSSALSFFNILHMPSTQQGQITYIPENIGFMEQPAVDLPVPVIEDSINDILPPAEAAQTVNPMQILLWAGAWVWLSGIVILTLYGVISYWKLHQKMRLAVWEQENIYHTEELDTPFVCGFLSPHIYLPARFFESGLSEKEEKEKSYIILHERIHIKRRDYIWRFISYFALCLHWFNPLIWLAFFLSGKDMEMACDEAVVRILGNDVKKEYSASLLSIASGRKIRLTTPLAFGEGETGSRIKNVLRYKKPAQVVFGIVLVVCIAAIVALAANPGGSDSESAADGATADAETDNADRTGSADAANLTAEVYPYIEIENFTEPEEGDTNQPESGIGDGVYRVYARSLSRSARGIDLYRADGAENTEELPFLAFSGDCKFMVNREMDTLRYEEVSFDEYADLTEEVLFFSNPSMILTFLDGLVTEAVLENYYGAGISFASPPPDKWYGDEEVMIQMTAQENLEANYTLEHQIYLDVGDGEGMERIEVYAGNTGDNGIVLIKNAGQEDFFTSIYAAGANTFRTGWNNIYLGYMNGYGFIMTLHIEDGDDFGKYDYYVFRLSEDGEAQQIAGSAFYFDKRGIPYDDALFAEWTKNLGLYLSKSGLVLSTQDGVLRTEMVSEADKYTYETLKPVK